MSVVITRRNFSPPASWTGFRSASGVVKDAMSFDPPADNPEEHPVNTAAQMISTWRKWALCQSDMVGQPLFGASFVRIGASIADQRRSSTFTQDLIDGAANHDFLDGRGAVAPHDDQFALILVGSA